MKFSSEEIISRTTVFIRRVRNYLLQINLSPVVLFRMALSEWEPEPVRLLIRNSTYSKATPGLVEEVFNDDPKMIQRFKLYLRCGAVGYLLFNKEGWIGYTWSVNLNFSEKRRFGRERPFTFVSLPQDLAFEENAYYGFAAEVKPRYRGKGVFLFLLNKSYEWIRSESPDAVIYTSVDLDNATSIKSKLKMGEQAQGIFYTMYVRIIGRHFSNVYTGRLKDDSESIPGIQLERRRIAG